MARRTRRAGWKSHSRRRPSGSTLRSRSPIPANLKRVGLELGGKTPLILFADADLELALPIVVSALIVFSGQFCTTGSRLLVHDRIADQVRTELAARLRAVRVGPAADPASEMGPIIDKPNMDRIDKIVEDAISQRASVIVRGGPATEGPLAAGAFYRPTLLEVHDNSLPIVQNEVFGPVLTMQTFTSEAEAIAMANDSEYGLSASPRHRRARAGRARARVWIGLGERLGAAARPIRGGRLQGQRGRPDAGLRGDRRLRGVQARPAAARYEAGRLTSTRLREQAESPTQADIPGPGGIRCRRRLSDWARSALPLPTISPWGRGSHPGGQHTGAATAACRRPGSVGGGCRRSDWDGARGYGDLRGLV